MTVVIFLAVLSVLVVVHELGHFLAARWTGVGVEEFGLGFPPRLIGWFKNGRGHWRTIGWRPPRHRHTIFSLNWIPLGGFVKLHGEDGIDRPNDPQSFSNKKAGQRILVVIAGVVMNIVLAAIIFIIGLSVGWPQATNNLGPQARVANQQIAIIEVIPDSPANQAGLQAGDLITSINQQTIASINQLRQLNQESAGQPLNYQIKRQETELDIQVKPQMMDGNNSQYTIGAALAESGLVSYAWPRAIWEGWRLTALSLKDIAVGFWQLLNGLFHGHNMADQVAGPVGIAVLTGQISSLGFIYLLQFVALLSLNLAFINILPLPALDGGRLLFIAIEKITGHRTKAQIEALVHNIGFILLLSLIILITFQDVSRLLR
ncbi:MAG TPA: RIP metalloprotease RseP [bacterium]|jgi:regulator of sigma E protease|nr:RIP metalloprotease RseP [bacterium]HNZ51405.1 RIP metalloprotease RseP [bacterium]HOH85431.1 RIP metalloprotease RseP [bacterium]HPX63863.1 RIP metalloprotease RseP [bacterium]HQA84108.1 RIP metalloprotease RseP [bacterium]